MLRIVCVTADSSERAKAELDREFGLIARALAASAHGRTVELHALGAVAPDQLASAVLARQPDIVHITGHSGPAGDELGRKTASTPALSPGLDKIAEQVRLVFSTAGSPAALARAVAEQVDFVARLGLHITAEAASRMAASLYLALGNGRSVQTAFDMARAALMLEDIPQSSTPELWIKSGADASEPLCMAAEPDLRSGPLVALPERLVNQLEPVRRALHQGKNCVLPVVGSGLAGPALPSWVQFLGQLVDRAPKNLIGYLRGLLDKDKLLDVVDMLQYDVGPELIAAHIEQTYKRPEHPPGELYRLVAALPVEHFATTEYHPWLKQAVGDRHAAPQVYTPHDPGAFSHLQADSPPLVLMLHGDADRPEHCLLSHRSLIHHTAYRKALGALAQNRSFLFIGQSLGDADITTVLEQATAIFSPGGGAAPRHYFLGAGLDPLARRRLPGLGVMPIEYGKGSDHSLLPAVLRYLAWPPGPPSRRASTGTGTRAFEAALAQYGKWARQKYSRIDMAGLGGGHLQLSFDDVFVPLHFTARTFGGHGRPDAELAGEIDLAKSFAHAAPAQHLFILGDPGAGKTTALKKLLWSVIGQDAATEFDGGAIGLAPGTVPVFIPLGQVKPAAWRRPLADLVDNQLAGLDCPAITAGFGRWLWSRGHLLLLFDGLDEVADPALRARVCEYLQTGLEDARRQNLPDIRAVVSCRHAGKAGAVGFDDSFAELEIRPLNDTQIERLTTRWFRAAELDRARTAGGDLDRAAQRGFARGRDLAQALRQGDYASRRIKTLVANPLLLTLLCVVRFAGNEIPRRRVAFFHDCLRTLLVRWRDQPLLQFEDALSLLGPLAAYLHEHKRKDLFGAELSQVLQPELQKLETKLERRVTFGQALDWLHRKTGVLGQFAPGEYGFVHLSLQEYLTARHAATHGQFAMLASVFGDPWWREVVLLFVALSEHRWFAPLIGAVIASDALTEHEALLRDCLTEAHAPDIAPLVAVMADEAETGDRLLAALRLIAPRADERAQIAARTLALQAGQPRAVRQLAARIAGLEGPLAGVARPGQAFEEATTGMQFLWIPGGRFRMGDDASTYDDEKPAHEVEISPFWLADTPVTNQQYQAFLEAASYHEPDYWRDRRFNDPQQPVVGVTWLDAMAFCAWLARESNLTITLPTEAQWEFAARGPDNRPYPWGQEPPDEKRAHFEANLGNQPLPVRSLPDGRGPFGAFDQAGTVWEWCVDEWDQNAYKVRTALVVDPVTNQNSEVLSGEPRTTVRGVRGGSWVNPALVLRAAFRDCYRAGDAFPDLGFRVVCLPAAPGEFGSR